MGKVKGKRGKNARRARQGQLGLIKIGKSGKKREQRFKKKQQLREEQKEEKRDLEQLKHDVHVQTTAKEEAKKPHSFVIHTGKVGKFVKRLERDLRRVMEPNTAADLHVTKRNNFKDFLVNSQHLGVSHLMVFTRTDQSVNLRIIRNNQGPTLHFRVENYSLARDVLASQKRPVIFEEQFQTAPLVILTGFTQPKQKQLNLVQTVIQNMFPSIDIDTLKLRTVRRAFLANYDAETEMIEFRHYAIKAVPAGLSRSTKKLMQSKIPDLSKYEDFSEYLLNPGVLSDSEYEGEQVEVDLPQDVSCRGLTKGQKTKIRLIEIGPRMTLKLVKIEEGINDGEVLYHSFVQKSVKEIERLRKLAPKTRRKKLMHEKNVEHAAIRKLKSHAERLTLAEERFNYEKSKLIQKQKLVTGDVDDKTDDPPKKKEVVDSSESKPAREKLKRKFK